MKRDNRDIGDDKDDKDDNNNKLKQRKLVHDSGNQLSSSSVAIVGNNNEKDKGDDNDDDNDKNDDDNDDNVDNINEEDDVDFEEFNYNNNNDNSNNIVDDNDDDDDDKARMAALLKTFTFEQLERYEHFRRSHLLKPQVKHVMERVLTNMFSFTQQNQNQRSSTNNNTFSPITISEKLLIIMGGVAKMFAGENARMVMEERGDIGAIQPRHLREAFRRMRRDEKILYLLNQNHNFFKPI